MDDKRRALIVSGISLGDITLALAGIVREVPAWVAGLDLAKLERDAEAQGVGRDNEAILAEASAVMDSSEGNPSGEAGSEGLQALRARLAEAIVEPAIARGKFLSATRCLEILDKKSEYVDKYLALAGKLVGDAAWKEAADALFIASSLELNEGTPLFQYAGPALHEACTTNREKCVTAIPREAAVLKALQYLLEGPKTRGAVGEMTAEARARILPHVALACDPDAAVFYGACRQAHADLGAILGKELADLRADLQRAAESVNDFVACLAGAGVGDVEAGAVLEKLIRTGQGLKKDFSDTGVLIDHLQMRRIRRRFEELVDARADLETGRVVLKKGSKVASSLDRLVGLAGDLAGKGITEAVDAAEQKLLATQVTMLGRPVASGEHWQYLRELAFRYPVSPLWCCIRPINAKWMVVPAWDSEIALTLREHFDRNR